MTVHGYLLRMMPAKAACLALACGGPSEDPMVEPEVATSPDYSACTFSGSFDAAASHEAIAWSTHGCDAQQCAIGGVAASALSQVQAELARVGVADRYHFLRANEVGSDEIELAYVVTMDWFEAAQVTLLPRSLDASNVEAEVQANFCLSFPSAIRPYGQVLEQFRSCDAEVAHLPCESAFSVHNGCSALALAIRDRPAIPIDSTCHKSQTSNTTVNVATGERISCSTGGTVCE
jgi:hypothetical protein